jgi:oligopeptidase B
MDNWEDALAHREDVLLEDIDLLETFLVVSSDGLSKINYTLEWKKSIICLSKAETYTAHATSNVDFDTDFLRYAYQSMATPASIIDFNMKTREK